MWSKDYTPTYSNKWCLRFCDRRFVHVVVYACMHAMMRMNKAKMNWPVQGKTDEWSIWFRPAVVHGTYVLHHAVFISKK
jgi:hypothetical protein